VSEIAGKDEDAVIEAHFDPESGIVTVYEGRPEFKALERATRRAGLRPARVREHLPYRMLEVEVAGELRNDPVEYAHALRHEAQALRHRAHEKLMREVFSGGVEVRERRPPKRRRGSASERRSSRDSHRDMGRGFGARAYMLHGRQTRPNGPRCGGAPLRSDA
jgi:hypothetical protein